MNLRRRRRRLRLIALGLATAALGASSAQAKPVIPYLSQGQGITAEVRAQLSNAGGPASGAFGNPAGTAPSSERSLQSNPAGIPCIAVAGRCIDTHSNTVAESAQSVASRYDDHRGEAVADPATSVASRYDDHRGAPVADSPKSTAGLNDRIHSRPLPTPADQQPSGTTADTDGGFNWSDAGVGAGSTLALVLLAGMAAITIRRSRRNQLAGT